MRKSLVVALVSTIALITAAPFSARANHPVGRVDYRVATTAPCAAACPYALDLRDPWTASCAARPLTIPGSWHDRMLEVPVRLEGAAPKLLRWVVTPPVDYDIVVCDRTGGSPTQWRHLAHSARRIEPMSGCLVGCPEDLSIAINPSTPQSLVGHQLVLRAYNWSDGPSAPAAYWFVTEHR